MLERTLTVLFLLASPCLAQLETPDDDPLYDELEALGWELTDSMRVPGVSIGCLRDGKLVWALGCGYVDKDSEELVTPDTIFSIGSISKTVAAWGAMRLVEAGKVDLDAPISKYVQGFELPDSEWDSDEVTLRRLLSHTAGLALHGYPGFVVSEELPTTVESLLGATNGSGDVHLIHEPGTRWKYSGGGYTLAQLLIEEVSGMGFGEFMRREVLLPLGMNSSDYRWTEDIAGVIATPHNSHGEPVPQHRFAAKAAASLQTNMLEFARFAEASFADRNQARGVLKAATIGSMQVPAPGATRALSPGGGYGLGYILERIGERRTVGHSGANIGWQAKFTLIPESGEGLILMTNGDNGGQLMARLERVWHESL